MTTTYVFLFMDANKPRNLNIQNAAVSIIVTLIICAKIEIIIIKKTYVIVIFLFNYYWSGRSIESLKKLR